MDLERMLRRCRTDQWAISDLDWSGGPRSMSPDDERAIVQYFTDMAGIERLAGALFREQRERTDDPALKEIFTSFVRDETRHAHVAERLARYYDVRRLAHYEMNPALVKFTPYFVDAVRYLSPEVANAYITGGELILDIALLRSLDDHVDDEMSHRAMELINRDESRHIAIDFHMTEYYASDEYAARRRGASRPALGHRVRGWVALAGVFYYAAPFFKAVFFEPMARVDPSGRRLREAFKRLQLLGAKPSVARQPFTRFVTTLQEIYRRPVFHALFGRGIERILGVDGAFMQKLYSEDEWRQASRASFDALATEALAAKFAN